MRSVKGECIGIDIHNKILYDHWEEAVIEATPLYILLYPQTIEVIKSKLGALVLIIRAATSGVYRAACSVEELMDRD